MIGPQLATKADLRAVLRKIKRTSGPRVIQVNSGGDDTVRHFPELEDVPEYAGAGNFLVRVKSTADQIEFVKLYTISDDPPSGGVDGDIWLEY